MGFKTLKKTKKSKFVNKWQLATDLEDTHVIPKLENIHRYGVLHCPELNCHVLSITQTSNYKQNTIQNSEK